MPVQSETGELDHQEAKIHGRFLHDTLPSALGGSSDHASYGEVLHHCQFLSMVPSVNDFAQTTSTHGLEDHVVAVNSFALLLRLSMLFQPKNKQTMSVSATVQLRIHLEQRGANTNCRALLHDRTAAQGWDDWPSFRLSSGGCMAMTNVWTSVCHMHITQAKILGEMSI